MVKLTWPHKRMSFDKACMCAEPYKLKEIFNKSINRDTTDNLYIEGDNLLAVKLLKANYLNKIKLIYIDPPYNTHKNFLYKDKFTQAKEGSEEYELGECESEDSHENWISMIYKRLLVSRHLLKDDGLIFVSIDENEHAYLKVMLDEIYGKDNFVNNFVWVNNIAGRQLSKKGACRTHEYILCYAKDKKLINDFFIDLKFATSVMPTTYKTKQSELLEDEYGFYAVGSSLVNNHKQFNEETRKNLVYSIFYNPTTNHLTTGDVYDTKPGYVRIMPAKNRDGKHKFLAWCWSRSKVENEQHNLIVKHDEKNNKYKIYIKRRENINRSRMRDIITDIKTDNIAINQLLNTNSINLNPKPLALIEMIIKATTNHNDIILDFYSGTATTGHAVMNLNAQDGFNRKYILVQRRELCEETERFYNEQYRDINDIAIARLKKVIKELEDKAHQDFGFKYYQVV